MRPRERNPTLDFFRETEVVVDRGVWSKMRASHASQPKGTLYQSHSATPRLEAATQAPFISAPRMWLRT